jgi:hypothetical protein
MLTPLEQSLSGYEPNSIASGISDTAAIVIVFDRSKDHFDKPKPISVSLTSREALKTVSNQVAKATDLTRLIPQKLIKSIVLTLAKSIDQKSLKRRH